MRTAIFIVCGLLLWAACLAAGKLILGTQASSMTAGTIVFVVLWFAAAASNMWPGIFKAGYSFAEELPIFLLIFLLPVLVAVLAGWRWFGVFSRG